MLRGAASRVGPLALCLREGARYFQEGAKLKRGGGVGKRYYTGSLMIGKDLEHKTTHVHIGKPNLGKDPKRGHWYSSHFNRVPQNIFTKNFLGNSLCSSSISQ